MNKYEKEFQALIEICSCDKTIEYEKIVKLIGQVEWDKILYFSIKNKVATTLSYHLFIFYNKLTADRYLPWNIGKHFLLIYNYNLEKKQKYLDLIVRIVEKMDQANIPIVVNKGLVLEEYIHYGDCRRNLDTDIDFMIKPEDREGAISVLNSLGIVMGHYDRLSKTIIEHNRKNLLIYTLNPDHLVPHVALIKEGICEFVDIDFSNSMTWHGGEYNIPMDDVLKVIEKIPVYSQGKTYVIPKLSINFEFIFLIMHLFREAWFYKRSSQLENDVNIMKFFDIYQYLKQHINKLMSHKFEEIVRKYNVEKPVVWTIAQTDKIFQSEFLKDFSFTFTPDESFLNSAYQSTDKIIILEDTIIDRICHE